MGASVHLLAHTGSVWRLRVMQCRRGGRRKEHGKHSPLKTMVDGPLSQVTRSSSKLIQVDVQGVSVQAVWKDWGDWQRLSIERKAGKGAVMPGDAIFFRAHTGNMIEVEDTAVQARWPEQGTWQELIIEESASRRLLETSADDSPVGASFGIVMV